jgi:hypothetical protein
MDLGQWSVAKPHAEAAAESGAGWAMTCAQRCAEGMKDWKRAELWAQRKSERYPEEFLFGWYLFCERTGKGDVRGAHALIDEYLGLRGGLATVSPVVRGYHAWLGGDLKQAMSSFRQSYQKAPNPSDCISMILLADQIGDLAESDKLRKALSSELRDKAPKTVSVLELVAEAIKSARACPLNLGAVNEALKTIAADRRPNGECIVGVYLGLHWKRAAARLYLEHCVPALSALEWMRALAAHTLRSARP